MPRCRICDDPIDKEVYLPEPPEGDGRVEPCYRCMESIGIALASMDANEELEVAFISSDIRDFSDLYRLERLYD